MSEYRDFDNLKTKFILPESKSKHSVDGIKGKRTCVISFVRSGGLKGRIKGHKEFSQMRDMTDST